MESFPIYGGYAWHAHKRFESIKNDWSFNKTVEWLDSVGIRFSNNAIRNFANVYSTFSSNFPPISTSLHECYIAVNQQADSLIDLPNAKARIIEKIFTALPSDDSTNLEWFTHPGLIPFLIPLLIPDN